MKLHRITYTVAHVPGVRRRIVKFVRNIEEKKTERAIYDRLRDEVGADDYEDVPVNVPTRDKAAFIEWLNAELGEFA